METIRILSSSAFHPHQLLTNTSGFLFNPSAPLKNRIRYLGGGICHTSTLLRATSDETSSRGSKFSWAKGNPSATVEDVPSVDEDETRQPESPEDESTSSNPMQLFNELLEKLNIKLDSEDAYKIFLYGGGALVALWLLSAIVGAIDSIPVFPKLMEAVGLGYSLWFTTRYVLFKRNREELVSKIEELKQEILGSSPK